MKNIEQKEMLSFNIRTLSKKDFPQIMRVEKSAWEPEWQASEDKFLARIQTFPEGVLGAFVKKELAGTTTSMVFNFDLKKLADYSKSWGEITGNGYITTHQPAGKALYIVSLAVDESFQGEGLGRELVEAQRKLAKKKKLDLVVLGSRLPGFRSFLVKKYPDQLPTGKALKKEVNTYLFSKRADGKPIDPEIRFYHSYCGFQIGKLIENFGPDEASGNFGVLMFHLTNST